MTDLVEFLRARIDEDEAWAASLTGSDVTWPSDERHLLTEWRERMLTECRAKRRQMEHLLEVAQGEWAPWNETQLKIMALVYADHRDYDESWRP